MFIRGFLLIPVIGYKVDFLVEATGTQSQTHSKVVLISRFLREFCKKMMGIFISNRRAVGLSFSHLHNFFKVPC
jgi:hypothetical protein